MARYNTDGSLDNPFSDNGKNISLSLLNAVVIQKDGKIVVAGGLRAFEIGRFNMDGSIDNTFSEDGYQTNDFSPDGESDDDNYSAEAVAIQEDGKIVVSGQKRFTYRGSSSRFTLARYNSDG
ncbi:MAG: delta-60 repeat domain-containing protein [Segetibacter sp.]